ncbi:hypothetical protein FYL79_26695, partial [Salmonella enterica subsp. enterica serovar Typhimurium]
RGSLRAKQEGVPVELLSFPAEQDMLVKVAAGRTPEAEIVRLRNNLCHGNILEFIMSVDIGTSGPIRIFTPECCRELAHELSSISRNWVVGLHKYWVDNNLISP